MLGVKIKKLFLFGIFLVLLVGEVSAYKFNKGDIVEVIDSAGLKVRSSPAGSYITTELYGALGIILDGTPQYAAGYWWWNTRYCDGKEGWSAEGDSEDDYLRETSVIPSTKFNVNDDIEVVASALKVRGNPPELNAINTVYQGETGTVTGGPSYGALEGYSTCYNFWKIDYGSVEGWSAEGYPGGEDYLKKVTIECTYGPCCDTSSNTFRPFTYKCDEDVNTDYGCPWGTGCGDNVGVHHQDRYCSGSSAQCNGNLQWDSWTTADYCSSTEVCVNNDPTCNYEPSCVTCTCTSWQNQGCGVGGCSSTEMYQTRTCTPSGCNIESQCIYDSNCETGEKIDGIDVSHWQHACLEWGGDKCISRNCDDIDWSQVYNANYKFVFVKATQGDDREPQIKNQCFRNDMEKGKNAGLLMGAYHFVCTLNDPTREANFFVDVTQDYIKSGYLKPVLDIETYSGCTPYCGTDATCWENVANWIDEWMSAVEARTRVEPILYVNCDYARHLKDFSISAKYDLWIAHYTSASVPCSDEFGWDFWQYSDQGNVPGITANVVDLDLFNGDMSRLSTFVIEDYLQINANFDSASIGSYAINGNEISFALNVDTLNDYTYWTNFKVSDVLNKEVTFRITNANEVPFLTETTKEAQMVYSCDGENWNRISDHSYSNPTYTFIQTFTCDEAQIATFFPYSYTKMHNYVATVSSNQWATKTVLGSSHQGRDIDLITITNTTIPMLEKKVIYIIGRQHSAETASSHMLEGMINFLISDNADAARMRDRFVWYIVPMVNPDGVYLGKSRETSEETNANRDWHDNNPDTEEINLVRADINDKNDNYAIDFFIDWHSQMNDVGWYNFIYSPTGNTFFPILSSWTNFDSQSASGASSCTVSSCSARGYVMNNILFDPTFVFEPTPHLVTWTEASLKQQGEYIAFAIDEYFQECNTNADCSFCEKCADHYCEYQSYSKDLKDECLTDECKYGYCDGSGACAMKPAETSCGSGKECDGNGDCVAKTKNINLFLSKGWNLISIPLEVRNRSINHVFNNTNITIYGYKNNSWFIPNGIDNKLGYWLRINESLNLTLIGTEVEDKTINLNEGWNLIGYPYLNEIGINNSDLKNYTIFVYINNSWMSYNPNRINSLNTLTRFIPGYGYWVKK